MFFKWLVLGKGGVHVVGREPADSSNNAVSAAMAHWNVQCRVFAVEQIFRNSVENKHSYSYMKKKCVSSAPPCIILVKLHLLFLLAS